MNYPNPFSDKTTFKFSNQDHGDALDIELHIYDIRGNLVFSIYDSYEISPDIIERLSWDGKDFNGYTLSQGIYIYKLQVQNTSRARNCIMDSHLLFWQSSPLALILYRTGTCTLHRMHLLLLSSHYQMVRRDFR